MLTAHLESVWQAVAPVLPWRKASTELLRERLFVPAWCGALALAVAEDNLEEYTDGVAFVDLATCTSPSLIETPR